MGREVWWQCPKPSRSGQVGVNIPHPTKQSISKSLTKQGLCKKGGVGERGCKESKRSLNDKYKRHAEYLLVW